MGKELTDQGDRQSNLLCALNCDDYCNHAHARDVWVEEWDKWNCTDCIESYFWAEIGEAVLESGEWDGESDMNEVLDRVRIEACKDSSDRFTGIKISIDNSCTAVNTLFVADLLKGA